MTDPDVEAPEAVEHCYRHPKEETRVHCTRCGRPICPECMHPAAVGHHCPTCMAEARRDARVPVAQRARGTATRLARPGGLTTLLLAANLTVFVAEIVLSRGAALGLGGGGNVVPTLVDMGGNVPIYVAQGQWWRLLSAMFLHVSLIHVGLNCAVLYQLGNAVEATLGRWRMLTIYLVGGFLASAASYQFSEPNGVGVGASGAVFALAGAWLAYHWRRRDMAWSRSNVQSIWVFLGINVLFGFVVHNIDQFAHAGGFVAGILAGVVAEGFGPPSMRPVTRVLGFVALIALGVAWVAFRTHELTGGSAFAV
jgi:membrane associated rhomboid family serine protease